ncbi:hypothetical protein C8Q80DRAFT_1219698 [Daedaleopsis nitida]|nr:hypothetical protein C8Q80DRAFT_1219698 [Daedaleopsis nitida]
MDAWPGHLGEQRAAPSTETGNGKAQDKKIERPWRYPVLDHGALGAATLHKQKSKGKRNYTWTFAAEHEPECKLVASGDPVEVFPPTRSKPLKGSKITSLQRAEQGAHFLRTYYPDVDIPAELIRDEIILEEKFSQVLRRSDILDGNIIDISSFQHHRKNVAFLAFPMGETCCQLNMSLLVINTRGRFEVKPSATVVHTFGTPIRQIVTSPHMLEKDKPGQSRVPRPLLGVRTMGLAQIMKVKVTSSRAGHIVETVPFITAQRSDLGDGRAVDMSIPPPESNAIGYIVNERGDLFRCGVRDGDSTMERIYASNCTDSKLCRVAPYDRTKVLSSLDNTAFLLDSKGLYTAPRPGTKIVSIDGSGKDQTIRLVSTEEIVWLDERYNRRPVLAIKHGREYDTTLRCQTLVMTNAYSLSVEPLTFLASRRNSLVTVYDVSRGRDSTDKLVHSYGTPYALPPVLWPDAPHLGHAFFQQPTLSGLKHLSVFQMSPRGGVSLLNFNHLPADSPHKLSADASRRAAWSPAVEKLADEANVMRSDQGLLAQRAHHIRKEESLSAQSNAVLDVVDRMPTFWQSTDVPVEHSVTMFDVAMRSGSEPSDASRNDWLTGSALDCAAGYRAWTQGRVPRERLVQRSPWHLDISPFIRQRVPEYEQEPQKMVEKLARYDLAEGPTRTADSFRREAEARSQLALDLSLAADVFSPYAPAKDAATTVDDDDMLSISLSTQAMSLGELEPPPVRFAFLRPTRPSKLPEGAGDTTIRAEDAASSKWSAPLGVRLLLQEWELGSDPKEYVYHDPYGDTSEVAAQASRRAAKEPARKASPERAVPPRLPTQRPPTIAPSMAIPQAPPVVTARSVAPARKPLGAARSQDAIVAQSQRVLNGGSQPTDNWAAPPSSQEPLASTQVLPGPHGGRPSAAKKKPAKKRVGGF